MGYFTRLNHLPDVPDRINRPFMGNSPSLSKAVGYEFPMGGAPKWAALGVRDLIVIAPQQAGKLQTYLTGASLGSAWTWKPTYSTKTRAHNQTQTHRANLQIPHQRGGRGGGRSDVSFSLGAPHRAKAGAQRMVRHHSPGFSMYASTAPLHRFPESRNFTLTRDPLVDFM